MPDEPATSEPDTQPDADQQPAPEPGTGRGWKIAATVAVLAAAISVGVLGSLLFAGDRESDGPGEDVMACVISRDFTDESSDEGDDCPPRGAERMDGLVQKTSDGGFTIRRIEGSNLGETVELHVREPDRPYIDIAHAQTHAALGQPVRVYLEEVDGRKVVVYMEDAPLLK